MGGHSNPEIYELVRLAKKKDAIEINEALGALLTHPYANMLMWRKLLHHVYNNLRAKHPKKVTDYQIRLIESCRIVKAVLDDIGYILEEETKGSKLEEPKLRESKDLK